MPVVVEIVDSGVTKSAIDKIFAYFISVDNQFSTYKKDSEISKFNRGEIKCQQLSPLMKKIFKLARETKIKTNGYFDIERPDGLTDPSGIVKGWAIYEAAKKISKMGFKNFYVDAGGDIQVKGNNSQGQPWKIGIRNPFNRNENIKIVTIGDRGIATSGTYIRGQHIYDPYNSDKSISEIVSFTVIGPNIYEADRFATAAFAMREKGIEFIAKLKGFEGYAVNKDGVATFTAGFNKYVVKNK